VNVMSVIRPIKADMDAWAAAGNPNWSWEHVLPVLKRLENDQDNPDSPDHGHGGPLYFERHYLFARRSPEPCRSSWTQRGNSGCRKAT